MSYKPLLHSGDSYWHSALTLIEQWHLSDINSQEVARAAWLFAVGDRIHELDSIDEFPDLNRLTEKLKVELSCSISLSKEQWNELRSTLRHVPLTHLAYLAEPLLGSNFQRKRRGAFYTPPELVEHILNRAFDSIEFQQIKTVIDPACGSGIFLLAALDRLVKREVTINFAQVAHLLCGIDIDPTAVAVARCLYGLKLRELFPKLLKEDADQISTKAIVLGDFLLEASHLNSTRPKDLLVAERTIPLQWPAAIREKISSDGVSLIIGNPPYGLSRDDQIDPLINKKLKKIYADSREGKMNKYLLFIARAHALLGSKGKVVFVVPNSWLGIRSARKLRRLLLEQNHLSAIDSFEKQTFPDLGLEVVVTTVCKNNQDKPVNLCRLDRPKGTIRTNSYVTASALLSRIDATIPLIWSEEDQNQIKELEENAIPLGALSSFFKPLIALQAYAQGKGNPTQTKETGKLRSFHSQQKANENHLRYLEGADVSPFAINWSGSYLHFGPWLAEHQPQNRFQGPRILLREVLAKGPYAFIAAYTDKEYVYNRSVLHIVAGPEATPEHVAALCAVFNSQLATLWIRSCGRKAQRSLFPKIVNDDLKQFPLARSIFENPKQLSELAFQAEHEISEKGRVNPSTRQKIDILVSEHYCLRNPIAIPA